MRKIYVLDGRCLVKAIQNQANPQYGIWRGLLAWIKRTFAREEAA